MDTINPSNLWEAVFITGISEEMRSIIVENNGKPTEEECLKLADSLGKLEKHRIPYYLIRIYPVRIHKILQSEIL